MQATDVQPSRFSKAKDEINNIIDGMGGGDQITLVLMHSFPEVLASNSTNKNELKAALNKAKVTSEPSNPKPSLILAAAAADRYPGTTVVVVSSGAFAREEDLPSLKAKIKYIKVGNSDQNQAISGLQLRETGGGPQLFVGLKNFSAQAAKVNLVVTVDNKQFDTRQVEINAEDKNSITLTDLPINTHIVSARIKPGDTGQQDYLAADNEAWTVRNAGQPQRLLLVTPGNTFLELFFNRLPNYNVTKVTPDNYDTLPNKDSFDLYIFDTYAPDVLPPGGVFFIDPPTSNILPVTGSINSPAFARLDQSDPLLRYTDLSAVFIKQATQYTLPSWMKVVASSSEGTPLLAEGDQQGQRFVLLTFDVHQSDLGLSTAWPILLINTLSWLQPAGALDQVTEINPGEPISFNITDPSEQISVTPPNNGTQVLKVNSGVASFTDTGQTGIYGVVHKTTVAGKTNSLSDNFVVNLYDDFSSNIRPLDDLGLQGTLPTGSGGGTLSNHEFWQPLVLAALIILMMEWWIFYQARRTRRKDSGPVNGLDKKIKVSKT